MAKKEIIVNTILLLNAISDNLEILIENKWAMHRTKHLSNQLLKELNKDIDSVYTNTDEDGMETVIRGLDVDKEIFQKLYKMPLEDKEALLKNVSNWN